MVTLSLATSRTAVPIPSERIDSRIYLVRLQKVLLDSDLVQLYGTTTRLVNQAVRRNLERFPSDSLIQLSREEIRRISQFETSPGLNESESMPASRFQALMQEADELLAMTVAALRTTRASRSA